MQLRGYLPCHVTVLALLFLFVSGAHAQLEQYTDIVVFGDSLSDTGNVATLSYGKYGVAIPGPAVDYTLGRFTDGEDTTPAARNYFGVWIEQLARMLPARPEVRNSLDGGTNYAYGFAFTGRGTTVLPLSTAPLITVTVDNLGRQITTYLATHPHIDRHAARHTLFVVWGGANDVLNATSSDDVSKAAVSELLDVERLAQAGATHILIPNLPPLGTIPRLNGSPATSIAATEASVLFNQTLALGLRFLPRVTPERRLDLRQLDVFTLFEEVLAAPSRFYLDNVTMSSRGLPTADPDTYLFWDDLHPTTRGHNIIALTALKLLEEPAKTAKPALAAAAPLR